MSLSNILSAGIRLLFFKAQRRGDDRTADLFPVEVPVEGHAKKDGTYVAPHTAIRHKKLPELPEPKKPEKPGREQAAVADLFTETEGRQEKPSTEFLPTHELPDGTPVVAHPDEPGVWVDKDGTEYESDNAYPLKPAEQAASEKPVETASAEDDATRYGLPEGARFKAGKGTLGAGKWMVELADGHATPPLPSKEQAADAARQLVAMRQRAEAERDTKANRERAVADKILAGEALTDQDLRDIGLRPGSSQYSYLSLAIQRLFKIDARDVRKVIGSAIREGHGKLGGRKEYADPRTALALVGEHLRGGETQGKETAETLINAQGKEREPATGIDYSLPFGQAAVPDFGVPAGVSKAERKRLNAQAREILASKTEGLTDEEKAILRQYSGTGGVGDSLNEFYTRADVAAAMWIILDRLGISRGQVAEPSCGPGVFLATAPAGVRVVGVELDNTSAQIAQALHGERHEVINSSLERFATTDGRQFDAFIGNVPFGLRGALIKEDKPELKTAEQYFLDTAIDKTREGGIVALIVPTGIMDGKNTRGFRERLLRKAEFVGAHRLPNTAFEHSHTNVTSDIVIFRKRAPDVAGALGTVKQQVLKDLGVWDDSFLSGRYFQDHPDHIYGTPEAGWRAKAGMGNDFTVSGDMAGVAQAIAESGSYKEPVGVGMVQVLEAIGDDEKARAKAISAALKPRYEGAKLGDTKVIDGVTYVLQGDPPRWHRADAEEETPAAVTDAAEAARMLEELFQAHQGRGAVPGDQRKRLAEALDAYIANHGIPAANKDLVRAAQHDKTLWRLIGAVNKDGSYSDLVTGRFADMDSSSFDAVAARLAIEHGAFTADDVANEWTGGDREAALDHLFASAGYAVDADGKTWTTIDSYLSGELWPKLDAAKAALGHEGLEEHYRAKYRAQAEALEKAIDPRSLEDVEITLNAGWVPLEVVADFFNQRIEQWKTEHPSRTWTPDPMQISYANGLYTVTGGMQRDQELLAKYLNRSGVRKDDLPTVETWNREFKARACGSEHREQLEDLYNRKFRGFRAKTFSDAPLDIPGLNPALDVNAYHFSGLRWALETGKGIVADDVGLGKTGRALMLARLLKITGQARKPVLGVPKSVLANWVAEADFWFPGSKVLVIGETYTRDKGGNLIGKTDTPAERNRKFHEISQNDYDFVLISQPVWNELDLDPIKKGEYVNDDFWVQRGDALGNAGDKRLKKIREAYNQAVAQRDFSKRTDAIYFNDLGVDAVLLDEGHAYKNLFAARARFGEQPKFLGGSGLSNRAHDTNLKTKWIREQNGGKGVFLLTATPTKNSPLEVYSMLSHIAPEAFEAIGIKNSEDFLDRFCEFTTDNILTVDGNIEEALVVSGFKNLSELREIMFRYIDRRTAEDVGLPLPARDVRQHLVEMSPQQKAVYDDLRELATKDANDDDGNAHIFSIMDKMAKAAIDMELLDLKKYAGAVSPKINDAADEIVKWSKEGGQVVFVEHVAVHNKLVQALVKRGIPAKRIAVVNAKVADTSAKRQNISDQFNAGKLDVVIGNVIMHEGMNLQKRTTDVHELDIPWDPATTQQRHGRGRRQGNKNESIRLHSYLAKGSFDGYRWQTNAAKKDWQDLLWHGGDRVENLAREGKFSREDMLIMLAADPEEARKQYEGNKAAALERAAAAGRAEAAEQFVRFQEMKRSYGALKSHAGPAAQRLRSKIESYRHQLQANKYFHAKEALDLEVPVLLQPDTGTAWHAGKAFEMDPGKEAPIDWSEDAKSKWVVTGVGESGGKPAVKVRPYGDPESQGYTVELSKMKHTVRPIEYSAEQERREIAAAKAEAATRAVVERALGKTAGAKESTAAMQRALEQAVETGRTRIAWHETLQTRLQMRNGIEDAIFDHAPKGMDDTTLKELAANVYRSALFADAGIPELKNPADLRAIPEELVTQFRRDIQSHLKDKARGYSDGWNGPWGLVDKDGKAVAKESFEGRKHLDTHDLMLPTAEYKAKAIDGWIAMEQAKRVKTRYVDGRRSRGSSYRPLKEDGQTEAYPGFEFGSHRGNPWDSIGPNLFGADFVQQAQAEFIRRWEEQPAANLEEAEALLHPISRLPLYGHGARQWPKEAVRALVTRATRSGWLNAETSPRVALLAKDAGLIDLAAATVVAGHKAADPKAALKALAGLMTVQEVVPPGMARSDAMAIGRMRNELMLSGPVREAVHKVVDAAGLGAKTVKEVAGKDLDIAKMLTGDYYPPPRKLEMTVNEMLGRAA